MEKNQYNLCKEVLKRFYKQGLSEDLVLIGSWCILFYKEYFDRPDELNNFVLKTRDIDFLVKVPPRMNKSVDIPELLSDLGFVVSFHGSKGYMKLNHPDLILEFLVAERSRGIDKPYPLPKLGINATALRFLDFLLENTIKVKFESFTVTVPHPANFALHKLIISQRRLKEEKAIKDNQAAIYVLKALIANGQSRSIRKVFAETIPKWQKKIIAGLKSIDEPQILNLITSND